MADKLKRGRWFERNPRKAQLFFLVFLFFALDFGIGYFWCPKIVGTPDTFYHHDLPKNYVGPRDWGGEVYELTTNSLGFKDQSVRNVSRISDSRRVLFIGDSFTEGVGFPFGQTFSGLFASRVASQGVEVLNAGVTSYSPKLYYLKTKYLLKNVHLDFDELIVFLDISDIQDEIAYEPFVPSEHFGVSKFFLIYKLRSFLKQNSITYYYYWIKRYGDSGRLKGSLGRDEDFLINDQEMADQWYIETSLWTLNERVYEKWGKQGVESARVYLDRLHSLCQEHQIQMTLVVYPWPRQIFAKDLDSLQVSIWRQFCRERKIPFLDLFPVFINQIPAEKIIKDYFIEGDVHWNRNGHKLVAETFLAFWSQDRSGARIKSAEERH